jgi:hypothetical protein
MPVTIADGWLSGTLEDDTGRAWPVKLHKQVSNRGAVIGTPNLVLHTTETDGYVEQLRYPSQWQTGQGQIGQHIRLGLAGDAVNEHDQRAEQIEMVGRSELRVWLPGEQTLGPTVALVAWLHRTGRIKTGLRRPKSWPLHVDQLPAAVTSYYRRQGNTWPDTPGVFGHLEVPDNAHWDPGGFDYPAFFDRVAQAIAVQTGAGGDDDVTTQELIDGWQRFMDGKPEPSEPGHERKGWNMARQATTLPKPGDHEHGGDLPAHTHTVSGEAS